MFQNIICPIDHGNQNIKSENFIFTSALEESSSQPSGILFTIRVNITSSLASESLI